MTVGDMLARITSTELTEWAVYERLYGPLGQERDDHLTALVSATIANAMRGKKGRRHKLKDFLPAWSGGDKPKQTGKEQLAVLRAMVHKMGGKEVVSGEHDR
jgi:hypothetical protein